VQYRRRRPPRRRFPCIVRASIRHGIVPCDLGLTRGSGARRCVLHRRTASARLTRVRRDRAVRPPRRRASEQSRKESGLQNHLFPPHDPSRRAHLDEWPGASRSVVKSYDGWRRYLHSAGGAHVPYEDEVATVQQGSAGKVHTPTAPTQDEAASCGCASASGPLASDGALVRSSPASRATWASTPECPSPADPSLASAHLEQPPASAAIVPQPSNAGASLEEPASDAAPASGASEVPSEPSPQAVGESATHVPRTTVGRRGTIRSGYHPPRGARGAPWYSVHSQT
jgi:hypothetical protein